MKAHPALFGGIRGGEELLFQSTIDIHIQITHKNAKKSQKTPNFERIAGAQRKNESKMQKKYNGYDLIKRLQLPSAKTTKNDRLYSFSMITFFGFNRTTCRRKY